MLFLCLMCYKSNFVFFYLRRNMFYQVDRSKLHLWAIWTQTATPVLFNHSVDHTCVQFSKWWIILLTRNNIKYSTSGSGQSLLTLAKAKALRSMLTSEMFGRSLRSEVKQTAGSSQSSSSLWLKLNPQVEAWDLSFEAFMAELQSPGRHSLKQNCKLNLKWKHLLGECTERDGERPSDSVTACKGIPAPLTAIYIYRATVFTYAHNPGLCVCVCVPGWVSFTDWSRTPLVGLRS